MTDERIIDERIINERLTKEWLTKKDWRQNNWHNSGRNNSSNDTLEGLYEDISFRIHWCNFFWIFRHLGKLKNNCKVHQLILSLHSVRFSTEVSLFGRLMRQIQSLQVWSCSAHPRGWLQQLKLRFFKLKGLMFRTLRFNAACCDPHWFVSSRILKFELWENNIKNPQIKSRPILAAVMIISNESDEFQL